MIRECPICNREVDWNKCFVCGREVNGHLTRSILPKEILGLEEVREVLIEDAHPICIDCDDFRVAFDNSFIRWCEVTKMFEWYRPESKKYDDFFISKFVYNVPLHRLKAAYAYMLPIALEAWRRSRDEDVRKERVEEFNYEWRQKDE